jgi:hypothetical protein
MTNNKKVKYEIPIITEPQLFGDVVDYIVQHTAYHFTTEDGWDKEYRRAIDLLVAERDKGTK